MSRRKNQTIVIAGGIEITVTEILRDKVRLGVTAPREIAVDRKEVAEDKKRGVRRGG